MSDFNVLSPTNPEWERMWHKLFLLTSSYDDEHPDSGEVWQYMGTFGMDRANIGSGLPLRVFVHEFRHRDRPADAKPIPGMPGSSGRILVRLTTSITFSGGWNSPFPEGTLVYFRCGE